MVRTHNTRSQPDLHKKNENVLATASHDGGPASIYHPSGSIGIFQTIPMLKHRRGANCATPTVSLRLEDNLERQLPDLPGSQRIYLNNGSRLALCDRGRSLLWRSNP